MLLERHDEWPDGREKRSERAIVKMVVDSGPAQVGGFFVPPLPPVKKRLAIGDRSAARTMLRLLEDAWTMA